MVETGAYPSASHFNPNFGGFYEASHFAARHKTNEETEKLHQATKWGVMLVQGGVAREVGFNDPLPLLCNPAIGIAQACKVIANLSRVYESETAIVAAYGAGVPRRVVPRRKFGVKGSQYFNQEYVDRVLNKVGELRRADDN